MITTSFAAFEQKAETLRAFLAHANLTRALLARASFSMEPTLLELDISNLKSSAPDAIRGRVMEHTLAVSHLYALYESFCEDLLSDWINFLTPRFEFSNLPGKIVERYHEGFSFISSLLPSARYPNLTIESVVRNYNAALQGQGNYSLDTECVTYHRKNLRWSELCQLFSQGGIDNLGDWVGKSQAIIKHFGDDDRHLVGRLSSKLGDLVQYRNDCSHGLVEPDEILGHEELSDFIDFICSIASALDQLVLWKKIEVMHQKGEVALCGTVTEVFAKANAFICTAEMGRFERGQILYLKKGANIETSAICSIRIDDADVASCDAGKGDELGLQCNLLPAKGSQIFR